MSHPARGGGAGSGAGGEAAWRSPRNRGLGLLAVTVHMAGVGMTLGLTYPLTSLVMASWGASEWVIGFVGAMAPIAILVLMPVMPAIVARLGAVRAMTLGCLTGSLALLLMPLLPHPFAWAVLRFAIGAGLALPWLVGDVWINTAAGNARRGLVIALYAAAFFAGFAVGPLLLDWVGIEGAIPFIVCAMALMVALAPLLAVARIAPPIAVHPQARVLGSVRAAPVVAVAAFVAGFAETMAFSMLPLFGIAIGLPESGALYLLSVFVIGGIVLQVLVSVIIDRFPRRAFLGGLGLTLLFGALAMPFAAPAGLVLGVITFLTGGAVLGVYGLGLTMLGDHFEPSRLATASAAFLILYQVGGIAGPIATGFAMAGSPIFGYVCCLGFIGASLALVTLWRRADPSVANPAVTNPAVTNPAIANPAVENTHTRTSPVGRSSQKPGV